MTFEEISWNELKKLAHGSTIVLEHNEYSYYQRFTFPFSSKTPIDDPEAEILFEELVPIDESSKDYASDYMGTIDRRMVYSGTIARAENEFITYSAIVMSVVPTLEDSPVTQTPDVFSCHGDKCRILDHSSKRMCEACNRYRPSEWPKYETISSLVQLREIKPYVRKIFIKRDFLTIDRRQDVELIKILRSKRASVLAQIEYLHIKHETLTAELKQLGAEDDDANLIEI